MQILLYLQRIEIKIRMGNRKTIDQWSFRYWIAKYIWAKRVFNLYYKKIELNNVGIIPRKKPVILAPNHQNALMDAMVLVTQLPFQTVFMARADIFKKPVIVKILTFMKIMPIYRIRDGISSLSQNEEIFDETTQILRNQHNPLCLFPEGNHGDRRRLRPLVKGIFRIAFRSQADYGSKNGLQIIPVGIDYSHYQKFGQTLFVNFGQPIEVAEFWTQFEENQAVATNALRDRLAAEMRKVIINIETEEYYDTYMGLREFYRPEMYKHLGTKTDKLADRFKADKVLINSLDQTLESDPDKIKQIDSKFKRYSQIRDKFNLRDWVFRKSSYSILLSGLSLLGLLILFPLFLLGFINNWPHFLIPMKFAKKIKDTQFQSTASWGSGIAIQAVYYFILSVLAIIFMPTWWAAVLYIAIMPLTGLIAYRLRCWFVKTIARLRYTIQYRKKVEIKEALQLRTEIIGLINSIAV